MNHELPSAGAESAGQHRSESSAEPWPVQIAAPGLPDELILARRIALGDRLAFEVLMRRHNRRLYRLARAVLRDRAEAEDALQECYLSVYRSIGHFRGDSSLSTWLCRLLLNECLGRRRRRVRRQSLAPMVSAASETLEPEIGAAADHPTPEQSVARAQLRAVLERSIDELPAPFRVVFVCREVEELGVEDTAQCLGIAPATVRSRHFRARRLLRAALQRTLGRAANDVFEFGGTHCDRIVEAVLARLPSRREV